MPDLVASTIDVSLLDNAGIYLIYFLVLSDMLFISYKLTNTTTCVIFTLDYFEKV